MDRLLLSQIDEDLESSEVAELCFLCSDIINRKRLEGIKEAKDLFVRLEEKSLLNNPSFLSQLLETIHRADLLNKLQTEGGQAEETDANPTLPEFRLMLYKIHEDLTEENLGKLKFLLKDQLARRPLERSSTALDVFAGMEKAGLISEGDVDKLHELLLEFDRQLALTVQNYKNNMRLPAAVSQREQEQLPQVPSVQQSPSHNHHFSQLSLSHSETQPCLRTARPLYSDNPSEPEFPSYKDSEFYSLTRIPRGLCVIINNEHFHKLATRKGTQADENAVTVLFKRFGFEVKKFNNLTADQIREELKKLGKTDFSNHDASVVFVLTHGKKGVVYGVDEKDVDLEQLIEPFRQAPSLMGKPKLFFIQACQDEQLQEPEGTLQADSSSELADQLNQDSDILLGMATVPNHKSYRHTTHGSVYVQELCRQLQSAAESPHKDDILTVLTRVNKEVNSKCVSPKRQMPEPKFTFTKRLVLRYV